MLIHVRPHSDNVLRRWPGRLNPPLRVLISRHDLMLTRDRSSIEEITDSLDQITRQRKVLRLFRADRDAGRIAGCLQKLKQYIDRFLVRSGQTRWYIWLCLMTSAGGKCSNGRDQSRCESKTWLP